MEMPQPNDLNKKLEQLVGTWSGEEKIHPNPFEPEGGTATGQVENRATLDGFAVVQDYQQSRENHHSFGGHGVFRYDAAREEYELYWFDTMGMAPSVFRGSFEGNVLDLVSKSPEGSYRARFEFEPTDSYRFQMEVSGDGENWSPFLEGTYHRT
jgi:hypothetical protein